MRYIYQGFNIAVIVRNHQSVIANSIMHKTRIVFLTNRVNVWSIPLHIQWSLKSSVCVWSIQRIFRTYWYNHACSFESIWSFWNFLSVIMHLISVKARINLLFVWYSNNKSIELSLFRFLLFIWLIMLLNSMDVLS